MLRLRLDGIAHMLVGRDDVHIVRDEADAAKTSPVSAVISTRVKPGREADYAPGSAKSLLRGL